MKTLRTLVEGAYKNGLSLQRHRISRQDAEQVREAEKTGGQQAGLRILLKILFKDSKR